MSSASERWTRRIMDGLGVRPVGHQDPSQPDGPQIPVQSPQPPAPQGGQRLPDWWAPKPETLPGLPPAPEPPEPCGWDAINGRDQPDGQDQAEPPPPPPAAAPPPPPPGLPVEKIDTAANRTGVRNVIAGATEDRYARVIAFNLTAGAVGYGLGLVDILGQALPAAEHGATGMLSLLTASAGGYAAWWCTRPPAVQHILPHPPVSRTVIALGAAEIGRRLATVPVHWLNTWGERWGLGPSAVSLLITSGAMCGGLYWLIDRRTRAWHWTARWMLRIPLASALLATALYAPGTTP